MEPHDLDLVVTNDLCGSLVAAVAIVFAGRKAAQHEPTCQRVAAGVAGLSLLGWLWYGLSQGERLSLLAMLSLIRSGITFGSLLILLSILTGILRWLGWINRRQWDRIYKRRERWVQPVRPEPAPTLLPEPPPPPKTKAELIQEANRQLQETIDAINAAPIKDNVKQYMKAQAETKHSNELKRLLS